MGDAGGTDIHQLEACLTPKNHLQQVLAPTMRMGYSMGTGPENCRLLERDYGMGRPMGVSHRPTCAAPLRDRIEQVLNPTQFRTCLALPANSPGKIHRLISG